MQTSFGQAGLQTLLSQQTLHLTSIPDSQRCYACLPCGILFPTAFSAETHLQAEHREHVAGTRLLFGNAGVARMITVVWIVDHDSLADAAVETRANDHHANDPVTLLMTVKNYSDRPHYPATISLRVTLPRTTATIVELAELIETAFVAMGGPADRIGWAEMITMVGIHIGGRGAGIVDTDGKLAQWVLGAGAQEHGHMDGDAA